MVSDETKRILGTIGLLFVLVLLVARALPSPGPSLTAVPRTPTSGNGLPRLIFHDNVSIGPGEPSFTLNLTQNHIYMWKFNVSSGSITATLAGVPRYGSWWTVGPNSTGDRHLNGIGVASFNWTAPASGSYILILQSVSETMWSSSVPVSVCDVRVWDLNNSSVLRVVFS